MTRWLRILSCAFWYGHKWEDVPGIMFVSKRDRRRPRQHLKKCARCGAHKAPIEWTEVVE